MLAPTGSRDRICNLYVFPSNGFNTEAADFSTSVGGSFTVAGYDFKGVYGVYRYHGSVIFESGKSRATLFPIKISTLYFLLSTAYRFQAILPVSYA